MTIDVSFPFNLLSYFPLGTCFESCASLVMCIFFWTNRKDPFFNISFVPVRIVLGIYLYNKVKLVIVLNAAV